MEQFLEKLAGINDAVNSFVWVRAGLWLLIAVGIIMSAATNFFQVGHLGYWMKQTIGSIFKKHVIGHTSERGVISPFQALCTALAATIGTGNI
ncbi:MAG: sodium:alanine symporter family protein, partial [Lachnospiraceae bacterium]|nr:sodium:alanine symporter family protein [Lachnospiraceae bacterium]